MSFTLSEKQKVFWFQSWNGLVVIIMILAVPLYVISEHFNFSSATTVLVGVSIAALRMWIGTKLGVIDPVKEKAASDEQR